MKKPAVALITGAARRVGAAIAAELHAAGFNVVLHCHTSRQEAETLCQQLTILRPSSAHIEQVDLCAPPDALAAMVERAHAHWGRLDVLVNNASRFYPGTLPICTTAMWDDLMTTNAKAPFFLSKAAAPFLAVTGHGNIVNITDIHGVSPLKNYDVYCLSKATLLMQTRVLARELAPLIRVNSVSPGAVAWPEGINTLSHAQQESIMREIPLRRHGSPGDIAKAVRFLVMDATYMTGQVLAVDGGRSLTLTGESDA